MFREKTVLAGAAAVIATVALSACDMPARAKEHTVEYTSSVRVDAKEHGRHHGGERQEAMRFAGLAKIDAAQAISAAQARVPGKVLSAALENEDGNLVYSVLVQPSPSPAAVLQDAIVDAGTGTVLKVSDANTRKDEDDEDDD